MGEGGALFGFLRNRRGARPDEGAQRPGEGSAVHLASQYQASLNGLACRGAFNGAINYPPEFCAVDVEQVTEAHKPGEALRQSFVLRDFVGQVVRTIDGENASSATPKTSDFEYQPFGRLTKLRANDGTETILQHDPYGRLVLLADPDSLSETSIYNSFGEVKFSLRGRSIVRTFNYDRLGRVTSAVDASGTTQWLYDQGPSALGQLSESISPPTAEAPTGQHVRYAYEPPTRSSRRALLKSLTHVIDGVSYSVGLQYDDLARPHQVSYPDLGTGAAIKAEYGYDNLSGALTSLSEVGGNATRFIWGVSEAFQGQLPSSIQFGNGAASTISYDPQRQFLDSIQTKLNGETIQNLGYKRLGNGQVRELSNIQGGQDNHFTYTYDSLGRLSQSLETFPGRPDATQAYGYDVHGNLSSFAGTLIRYENAKPHLPTNVGSAAYTHDPEGRLASRTGLGVPSSSQVFTYTPFDLPATITTGTTPGRVTQFEYTADQQRVVRRDPDRTRHFAGDFYERVLSPSGVTEEEHFRLSAGGVVAEIIRTPAGDQTLYFHPDALGTPETLTDAGGNVTRQAFAPFGTRRDGPAGPATRIGYTGHQQDDDLGLIDMGGRVYDPLAGRFTTADPIMQAPYWSQGQNRYAYVFNDPLNNTDPSGFMSSSDIAGGAAPGLIGGGITGGAYLATHSASLSGWGIGGGVGGGIGNVVNTLQANPFRGSGPGAFSVAAPSGTPNANPVKPGGTNAVGQGSAPRVVREGGGNSLGIWPWDPRATPRPPAYDAPPTPTTEVMIGYTAVRGGCSWSACPHHTFIILREGGQYFATRAGPSGNAPSYGRIDTDAGPWDEYFPDRPDQTIHIQSVGRVRRSLAELKRHIRAFNRAVDGANIPYSPYGANSNTYSGQFLRSIGMRASPDLWAPGFNGTLRARLPAIASVPSFWESPH